MNRITGSLALPFRARGAAIRNLISRKLRQPSTKDLPGPLRLYRSEDMGMAYVWLDAADGMITLKVGNLGHPGETAHYAAAHWPRIRDHLDHLRDQGFAEIPAREMEFLRIVYRVTGDTTDPDERARRDALIERVTNFLARTGQGNWIDSTTDGGAMDIGFRVVDFDIACATLTELLDAGEFGDCLAIRRQGEPVEPRFDNPAAVLEPGFQMARPARPGRPGRPADRFADLAPAS